MRITILIFIVFGYCSIVDPSEKKDSKNSELLSLIALSTNSINTTQALTDVALYKDSVDLSSLSIFPNTPSTIFNSGISDRAHGDSILMRVNGVAKNSIDASAKKPINGSFSDGSLIVKERYSGGTLVQIISMKKQAGFTSGWAWGEYSPSGSVQYSVNLNGAGCINCHTRSGGATKDYVRIFEY